MNELGLDGRRYFKNRASLVSDADDQTTLGGATREVSCVFAKGYDGFLPRGFDVRILATVIVDGRPSILEIEIEPRHRLEMQELGDRS